jgi:hypothetical protein
MAENTDKRTATQRIEDLEKVVTVLFQNTTQMQNAFQNLSRLPSDIGLMKEALKLLNKRTEAIIQVAAPETGITSDAVSDVVVKMNVEDLKAQVAAHLANGHLVPSEEVSDNSYVVAEEYNPDGSLANPRVQFRLDSLDDATKELLKGKKAGDSVSLGENKTSAKVLEVYALAEPKAPEAAPAEAAEAAAPSAEALPSAAAAPVPGAALNSLPEESPVTEFVPSDASMMATASQV